MFADPLQRTVGIVVGPRGAAVPCVGGRDAMPVDGHVERGDFGVAVTPDHEIGHVSGVVNHQHPTGFRAFPVDVVAPVVVGVLDVVSSVEHLFRLHRVGQTPGGLIKRVDVAEAAYIVQRHEPAGRIDHAFRQVLDFEVIGIEDSGLGDQHAGKGSPDPSPNCRRRSPARAKRSPNPCPRRRTSTPRRSASPSGCRSG